MFDEGGVRYVVDTSFGEMFETAFVNVGNVSETFGTFVGTMTTYQALVYMLYKLLVWWYEEKQMILSPHRAKVLLAIMDL